MMRMLKCFALTSIVFVFIFANAYGQEPEPSQKKDKSSKKEKESEVSGTSYCPMYPYAYHGSYVSYYALQHDTCDNPASVDGPPNLYGACYGDGTGCLSMNKLANEARALQLTKNGLKGVVEPRATHFFKGAHRVGKPIVVRFRDVDDNWVHAKLFKVKVNPSKFELDEQLPPLPQGSPEFFFFFIGYQITNEQSGNEASGEPDDGNTYVYKVTWEGETYQVQLLQDEG